jgi:membrane fusion protein YbhG
MVSKLKANMLLVGAAAIAALAAAAIKWRPLHELIYPDQAGVLLLSGNVEAHESVLGFQVGGRIVDLQVEAGQWVERDAILARLDERDLRAQAATNQVAVDVAEAQLQLALAGTRHQEIEAIRQAMLRAEATLAQSQLDYDRAEKLYQADATAKANRDQAETNLKAANAAYRAARQLYDQVVEGTRKEEIEVAAANVDEARESLKFARIQLDHAALRSPT